MFEDIFFLKVKPQDTITCQLPFTKGLGDLVEPDLIEGLKKVLQETMVGKKFNIRMVVLSFKRRNGVSLHKWRSICF